MLIREREEMFRRLEDGCAQTFLLQKEEGLGGGGISAHCMLAESRGIVINFFWTI